MTDNTIIYNKDTLAEIFNLRKGDIDMLIKSEGVPCFMTSTKEFVGFLPSLNTLFKLDDPELIKLCGSNVKPRNYKVKLDDSVLSIESRRKSLPASSLLFGNKWIRKASRLLELNDEFLLLIPERSELPFFCGHEKIINRLAENFAGDIYLVNALEFARKVEQG